MHTKHTLYRRKRKGVSTILGTLIFIGIMFSAYIPMTLVMKQADSIYERKIYEARVWDIDKGTEDAMVYAYGVADSTELSVYVTNKGINEMTIVRVWLNDVPTEVSALIVPKASAVLGPYLASDTESPLKVKVTTENGNVFECNLGAVMYSEAINGWYTPSYAVSVLILNDWGQYEIILENSTNALVGYYMSSGNEHDDITKTFLVAAITDIYDVEVLKKVGGAWENLIGPGFTINVPSEGNPVVYVVVDGT